MTTAAELAETADGHARYAEKGARHAWEIEAAAEAAAGYAALCAREVANDR